MSNALHDYASLFERYAANNNGMGVILAGEDCLDLANEMRIDADAIEAENAKLRNGYGSMSREHSQTIVELSDAYYEIDRLRADNAKLRELCAELLKMAESNAPEWLHWPEMHEELRKLGVDE